MTLTDHGGNTSEERTLFTLTQLGLAKRFVARFGRDLHYCYARRCWLHWDDTRWVFDDGSYVEALMKEAINGVFIEAAEASDAKAQKALANFALKMEKRAEQKAALELARSEPGIPIRQEKLDSHQWLLNVQNGTIDLRDCSLREPQREDLLTQVCSIEYDASAKSPRWTKFLEEIVPDSEVRHFLKKAIGYSLTGSTREHLFFICHGRGANGKTLNLPTIWVILGVAC